MIADLAGIVTIILWVRMFWDIAVWIQEQSMRRDKMRQAQWEMEDKRAAEVARLARKAELRERRREQEGRTGQSSQS